MRVLIACEESQAVCIAFRNRGHEAYSCDIQECSGGYPEWHIKMDCHDAICNYDWDFIGFHPDCTYIAVSGNRWYGLTTGGYQKRIDSILWTKKTWELIKKRAKYAYLENPVSVIFKHINDPVQYVQPWMFGHGETKKTGLALYNLSKLIPTNIVNGREQKIWKMPPSKNRKKLRSKTYAGIADAIAVQWG